MWPPLLLAGLLALPVLVARVVQVCWNNLSASVDGIHRIGLFQAASLVVGAGCLALVPILLFVRLSAVL